MATVSGSFRDPSGFVFEEKATVYRQVNQSYQKEFEALTGSGLCDDLVEAGLLVKHKDVSDKFKDRLKDGALAVIKPQQIPFISYPYEWSFSQLKDAALTTLEIQRRALEHGLSLKDASAYNIQFLNGTPIFIDTLSFELYKEGEPWVAYKQFCQHFLAPLALMAQTDVDLSKLLQVYIDGVPLPLAAKLLPTRSRLNPLLYSHLILHARSQQKHAKDGEQTSVKAHKLSKRGMVGLITSLASVVNRLNWKPAGTEWGDYYTFTNYSSSSFTKKRKIIEDYLDIVKPKRVWDIGANNGLFSRIASTRGINTVAFDIDPIAVEKNYRQTQSEQETTILPLVMDLTNPSPRLGWAHEERLSMADRGPADVVFALALIHHLSLSNNVPLPDLAKYLRSIGRHVVIEWVPKGDSQVDLLLRTREDIFPNYTESGFEAAFEQHFTILEKRKVTGSKRILYLLKSKG